MTYHKFKEQLSNILDTDTGFDPEWYQEWYIDFKESVYDDVEEFARFWLQEASFDTHSYQLKSK